MAKLFQGILKGCLVLGSALYPLASELPAAALQNQETPPLRRAATYERPDPLGTPTRVHIGAYLIDLLEINDIDQNFTADVFLILSWQDPRLAVDEKGPAVRMYHMNEIWHPQIDIFNQRSLDKHYEDILRVNPQGRVNYVQRYYGEFSAPLQFKSFPFDHQILEIQVGSFMYGPDEVILELDKQRTGQRETLSIIGWSVEDSEAKVATEYLEAQSRNLARMDLRLNMRRHTGYYFIKVLIPLLLIMLMAWLVFWIDPSAMGPQIGIPTSSVFALILYLQRTSQILPRISYLTGIDRFILGALLLVFLTLAEAVTTTMLVLKGREKLARSIDSKARYIYLIAMVLVVINAFLI